MLTIFIDALSHRVACNLFAENPSLLLDRAPQRLKAGAGYSSNLHWQLFAGLTADQLGFFCDWGLNADQSYAHLPGSLNRLLQKTEGNSLFNGLVRIARRKLARQDDNIPWSQRHHFRRTGSYLFSTPDAIATAERARLGVIEAGSYPATLDATDAAISAGRRTILAVINELDGLGHKVGGSAPDYTRLARQVLERAQQTVRLYRAAFPSSQVRLMSDHGMHDVHYSIDPSNSVLRHMGLPGHDYLFYTDSVYLRAWFRTPDHAARFTAVTNSIPALRVLAPTERAELGIYDTRFGDVIGVLADGAVFAPNMFSLWVRGGPCGMHGYLSDNSWSCGFYVDDGLKSQSTLITPREVAMSGVENA